MKVAELIEKLKELPQNARVFVGMDTPYGYSTYIGEITVEHKDKTLPFSLESHEVTIWGSEG